MTMPALDGNPPSPPLTDETAKRFVAKYTKYYNDGTFDNDPSKLEEAKSIAKELGITYGSNLMPKYVSKRSKMAIETARAGIKEQGLSPVVRKGQVAQGMPEPPSLSAAGIGNTLERILFSTGAAPILATHPNDPVVRQQVVNNVRSATGAAGAGASSAIPGTLGAIGGGAALGSELGIPGMIGGGILGAVAGSGLAGGLERRFLTPEDYAALEAARGQTQQAHPYEAAAGGLVPSIAAFGSNPLMAFRNGPVNSAMAGLPAAQYAINQLIHGQPVDPKMAALELAGGLGTQGGGVLGRPTSATISGVNQPEGVTEFGNIYVPGHGFQPANVEKFAQSQPIPENINYGPIQGPVRPQGMGFGPTGFEPTPRPETPPFEPGFRGVTPLTPQLPPTPAGVEKQFGTRPIDPTEILRQQQAQQYAPAQQPPDYTQAPSIEDLLGRYYGGQPAQPGFQPLPFSQYQPQLPQELTNPQIPGNQFTGGPVPPGSAEFPFMGIAGEAPFTRPQAGGIEPVRPMPPAVPQIAGGIERTFPGIEPTPATPLPKGIGGRGRTSKGKTNAAQQNVQQGVSGSEHQGGKGGGKTPKTGSGNSPVGPTKGVRGKGSIKPATGEAPNAATEVRESRYLGQKAPNIYGAANDFDTSVNPQEGDTAVFTTVENKLRPYRYKNGQWEAIPGGDYIANQEKYAQAKAKNAASKFLKGSTPRVAAGSEEDITARTAELGRLSAAMKARLDESGNPDLLKEANNDINSAIQAWGKNPEDNSARITLVNSLRRHGIPIDEANEIAGKLQDFQRVTHPGGGGANASLFGAGHAQALINQAKASRQLRRIFKQAPYVASPDVRDANKPRWDTGLFNLPLSVRSPLGETHQEGMLERTFGVQGAVLSDMFAAADRRIADLKNEAHRRLDSVQAFLDYQRKEEGATSTGDIGDYITKILTGTPTARERFNSSFRAFIELPIKDQQKAIASGKIPPAAVEAVKAYHSFTDDMKHYLYDYMVNDLKRTGLPPEKDWGITDRGYFYHTMFHDFNATMADASGKQYPITADSYPELMTLIEGELKKPGHSLIETSARENRYADPTVRINQLKFWKLVEEISKSPGLDSSGRRILPKDDVLEDVRGIVGTEANKTKFIPALMKRAGAEGYESDMWRYIMNRYADQSINGVEISRLRKQAIPVIEQLPSLRAQSWAKNRIDLLAGKPTDTEEAIADGLHTLALNAGFAGAFPNPLRSFKNLAQKIQGGAAYAALLTRPMSSAVNLLQPLTTLYPRIGEKPFIDAVTAARNPANIKMMRELGVLSGDIKIINRGGTLQAVMTSRNKGRYLIPIKGTAELFRSASEENRAIGFMHGYNTAKAAGLSNEDAISEGLNWSILTEFRNNNFYNPDILTTTHGQLQFQFQGYTINNMKQWWDAVRAIKNPEAQNLTRGQATARLVRKGAAQVAVGGVRSLAPIMITAGTYFYLQDHGVSEPIARTVAYGLPSLAGIDMSGQTAPIPDVVGDTVPEWLGTVLGGPALNLLGRTGQALTTERGDTSKFERVARGIPAMRQGLAVYSLVTGQPLYYSVRGMKDGAMTDPKDKLIMAVGGLPFEMTQSRGVSEEKRTRKNPGMSLDDLIPHH